jgi:hypothetical protein
MAEILAEKAGLVMGESFHTIHNYIDTEEMILRKGSIAAHKGEKVLIPINMRDGSVLAVADRIILRLVIVFRELVRRRKAELLKRIQKADLQIALRGFHEIEHIHAKLFALFGGKCLGKIDDTVVIIVFAVLGKTGLQLAGIPVICCRNAGKSEKHAPQKEQADE